MPYLRVLKVKTSIIFATKYNGKHGVLLVSCILKFQNMVQSVSVAIRYDLVDGI